tara:strand:- start:1181 stop:2458 length:1278 start_codon:yes stop_codon:yes gene_type:complete
MIGRLFAKLIYLLGICLVNPKIFEHYRNLKKSEFFSDRELDELQLIKLRKLLKHAKDTCPFYSKTLRDVDVESITLQSLSSVPILTKEDLRGYSDQIYSSVFQRSDLIKSETSGSTGDAFIFYRDRDWDAAHRGAITRGIEQHGLKPWDRNLYLWGFIFDNKSKIKIRLLDFLQNRFRIFQINEQELSQNLSRIKDVRFISGYSSVIDRLVQLIEDSGTSMPNLLMLKGTSEKIFDSYQIRAKRVLGIPIVSEYGAAETGIISYTCPEGTNHTIRENVIVECVDGRAVITNLNSFSMPIIRFDLGDYIELETVKCNCGRHSQAVKDILGRVGTFIYGRSQNYPTLTLYYIFKDLALSHNTSLSYQGVQNVKGELQLIIFDDLAKLDVDQILTTCKKYLPDVEVEIVQGIFEDRKNKIKDFVSNIT